MIVTCPQLPNWKNIKARWEESRRKYPAYLEIHRKDLGKPWSGPGEFPAVGFILMKNRWGLRRGGLVTSRTETTSPNPVVPDFDVTPCQSTAHLWEWGLYLGLGIGNWEPSIGTTIVPRKVIPQLWMNEDKWAKSVWLIHGESNNRVARRLFYTVDDCLTIPGIFNQQNHHDNDMYHVAQLDKRVYFHMKLSMLI